MQKLMQSSSEAAAPQPLEVHTGDNLATIAILGFKFSVQSNVPMAANAGASPFGATDVAELDEVKFLRKIYNQFTHCLPCFKITFLSFLWRLFRTPTGVTGLSNTCKHGE